MYTRNAVKIVLLKEKNKGPKPGDQQKNQEGGRGGQGTRPSGTGSSGQKSGGGGRNKQ